MKCVISLRVPKERTEIPLWSSLKHLELSNMNYEMMGSFGLRQYNNFCLYCFCFYHAALGGIQFPKAETHYASWHFFILFIYETWAAWSSRFVLAIKHTAWPERRSEKKAFLLPQQDVSSCLCGKTQSFLHCCQHKPLEHDRVQWCHGLESLTVMFLTKDWMGVRRFLLLQKNYLWVERKISNYPHLCPTTMGGSEWSH